MVTWDRETWIFTAVIAGISLCISLWYCWLSARNGAARAISPPVRRRVKWFTKQALIDASLYTAKHQLGEPPAESDIISASEDRFPAVTSFLHDDVPGGEPSTFYRCIIYVQGAGYRVSVTPERWLALPEDDFDLPF